MSSNDIDYFDEGFNDEKEIIFLSNNKYMSNYKITNYSKNRAKKLGVTIKPSTNKKKKIDVFKKVKDKDGKMKVKKVASIGASGYGDFPTFTKEKGKEFADKKRKAYKARHEKDRHKKGSAGYYADQILW